MHIRSLTPVLKTSDLKETIRFYTENLFFTLVNHPDSDITHTCTLKKDSSEICFVQSPDYIDHSAAIFIEAENPEFYRHLLDPGLEPADPEPRQFGAETAFAVSDNNGYRLLFGRKPDPSSQYDRFFSSSFALETPRVLLRLMQDSDEEIYRSIKTSSETWQYFTRDLNDPVSLREWMDDHFREKLKQTRVPFTIIDKDTDMVCGSSSYGNISFYDKRLEIGWSWLGDEFRGAGVNKHAKFALLSFAFEIMQMERVEIKTDLLNERAKAALLKVGMIPEGVLRSHTQMHSNRRRDTIYYGLLKNEWAERKPQFFGEML